MLPSGGASSSHYHRTGQEAAWSNLRRGKMRQYRCYLLNTHGSVVKREVFDSDEDEQAKQNAMMLLIRNESGHGLELWDSNRRGHVYATRKAMHAS